MLWYSYYFFEIAHSFSPHKTLSLIAKAHSATLSFNLFLDGEQTALTAVQISWGPRGSKQ